MRVTATLPTPETSTAAHLIEIPIGEVYESPLNTRQHYDEKKMSELADSIARSGQLAPAVVRPNPNGKGGLYEIAAGHRRYRARKKLKHQVLLCLVRAMDEAEFLQVLTIENLQREDLHPLDEALGFRRLLELPGFDVEVVAGKVGKSPSYLHHRLKLCDLSEPARKAFLSGGMLLGHALVIARLQPKDQQRALAELRGRFDNELRSVSELKRWVGQEVLCDLQRVPFATGDATLVPAAGSCTACPKRTGHQRELMPEVDIESGKHATDRCLDPACYQGKLSAFVQIQRTKAATEHPDLLSIATWHKYGSGRTKGVLYTDQWWKAKKGDAKARAALVVEGYDDVGKVIWVTTQAPRNTYSSGVEPSAAQRSADKKRKRELVRRRRIYDALTPKLPTKLGATELRGIIAGYLYEMTNDSQRVVAKVLNLEPAKNKHGGRDFTGPIEKQIATYSVDQLTVFLQQLTIIPELTPAPAYARQSGSDKLLAAAKACRIDVKRIDRDLASQEKAKTAKRAKAKPTSEKRKSAPKKRAGDVRRQRAKARGARA